jgi:hypothetical protein
MTSLLQSWIANREFFVVAPRRIDFFGTQLVLISRQLNVIAETVNEVRFTLDSVFIGPNERQSMLLEFKEGSGLPPMFLEDMLVEIEKFVTDEGPSLLRDGGKISVTNNILPVVESLQELVRQSHHPENNDELPEGFRTARVRRSLKDLERQLKDLVELVKQVKQQVPPAEDDLVLEGLVLASSSPANPADNDAYTATLSIIGSGIDFQASVEIHSPVMADIIQNVTFVSAERIDVDLSIAASDNFSIGDHDVKVRNPDGESEILLGAFHWDGTQITIPSRRGGGGGNGGDHGGGGGRGRIGGASAAGAPAATTVAPPAPPQSVSATAAATPTAPVPPAPPAVTGDDLAAVHDRIDKMHQSQETWFQKMEDKMSDFFEGKSKKKKTDDD